MGSVPLGLAATVVPSSASKIKTFDLGKSNLLELPVIRSCFEDDSKSLINFNLHDFWNTYEGVNPDRELQNFYKNLGIFAGLLLLAAVNMEQFGKSE